MGVISKIREVGKAYWIGGALIVLLIVNLFVSVARKEETVELSKAETLDMLLSDEPDLQEEEQVPDESLTHTPEYDVIVDVKGAVNQPGVFKLRSNQRVIDAIDAADGLAEAADTKQINFARILEDEMFIYIPVEGETIAQTTVDSLMSSSESSKININEADEQTLLQLNGIGPSKASEIINYREENGPFEKTSDITNVSGIGEKTFEKIEERIDIK